MSALQFILQFSLTFIVLSTTLWASNDEASDINAAVVLRQLSSLPDGASLKSETIGDDEDVIFYSNWHLIGVDGPLENLYAIGITEVQEQPSVPNVKYLQYYSHFCSFSFTVVNITGDKELARINLAIKRPKPISMLALIQEMSKGARS